MFEPLTLRMPELAERWKMTPVQALEFADVNGLPIYFNFSGLAFFDSNEWCRTHGDQDIRRELKTLSEGIASGESWFARRSRGETGKYDCLTDQEAQELRQSIENSKRRIKAIKELLEQREIDRKRYRYSGPMGAGGQTLFEVRQSGKSGWPRFGIPPGRNEVIFLEYFTDSRKEPLTIDSLFVVLREVKAGEIYFKAKQAAPEPQPAPPAPIVAESAQGDEAWKERAREKAGEIIKRQKAIDAYPSQEAIADEIARAFRQDGIVGAGGKPLTGAYIKRHALKGISSEQDKQLSTSIRRGK